MDSSVSPTHGDQEGSAWNGHFDCTCYHRNFLFNQFGILERCTLRNGNVHSTTVIRVTSCLIPRFDGVILSQEWKEALWDKFVTVAPRPRTPSELQYSDRRLRSRS